MLSVVEVRGGNTVPPFFTSFNRICVLSARGEGG